MDGCFWDERSDADEADTVAADDAVDATAAAIATACAAATAAPSRLLLPPLLAAACCRFAALAAGACLPPLIAAAACVVCVGGCCVRPNTPCPTLPRLPLFPSLPPSRVALCCIGGSLPPPISPPLPPPLPWCRMGEPVQRDDCGIVGPWRRALTDPATPWLPFVER